MRKLLEAVSLLMSFITSNVTVFTVLVIKWLLHTELIFIVKLVMSHYNNKYMLILGNCD